MPDGRQWLLWQRFPRHDRQHRRLPGGWQVPGAGSKRSRGPPNERGSTGANSSTTPSGSGRWTSKPWPRLSERLLAWAAEVQPDPEGTL